MAHQDAQPSRSNRARPSLQPPAVATGATKFSRSSSCGAVAPSQEPAASLSLRSWTSYCNRRSRDRFRQGKGALTHPPPPTSPALKTHATFLCSARPSRRFGQLSSRAPPPRPHTPPTPSPQCRLLPMLAPPAPSAPPLPRTPPPPRSPTPSLGYIKIFC